MNFDEAIKAHTSWKIKLSTYLKNPDKSLDSKVVCKDNQCDLGKWIYGEGSTYSSTKEFIKVKTLHAEFHKEAAEIIEKADTGQNMTEEVSLGSNSKFSKLSNDIVSALMKLRTKLG